MRPGNVRRQVGLELERDKPDEIPKLPFRKAARFTLTTAAETQVLALPWGPAVDVMFDPQGAAQSAITVRLYAVWEGTKVLVDQKVIAAASTLAVLLSATVGADSYVVTAQPAAVPSPAVEQLVVGYVYEGAHSAASALARLASFASWSSPAGTGGTAYETTRQIKAAPGTLYMLFGFNASASTRYVQLYDAVAAPATSTPATGISIPVGAGAPFSLDLGDDGLAFATGIFLGLSLAGDTYQPDATALAWFKAKVL